MMKFLAVLSFCVVVASARSQTNIMEKGPECPFNETTIVPGREFNVSLLPILVINPGAVRSDLVVTGLQTLTYEYTVTLISTTIDFEINLPSVNIVCDSYSGVVGTADFTPFRQETVPSGDFVGEGAALLTAAGVHLKAKAVLLVNFLTNRVTCRELSVSDLSFDSLAVDLGQKYLINGAPIDWVQFSATFKDNFAQDWATFQPDIEDNLRISANNILEKYTLDELLEMIGGIGGQPGEC